jgi:hypothetical protein
MVMYGLSKIDIKGATMNNDGSIALPSGKDISVKSPSNPFERRSQRDLQAGIGGQALPFVQGHRQRWIGTSRYSPRNV